MKKYYSYWEYDQENEMIRVYDKDEEEIESADLEWIIEEWLLAEGYKRE